MITLGFSYDYSDLVTLDQPFPFPSTYILVGITGDIVFENRYGELQWVANAQPGYHPIAAKKIVTSGDVNDVPRSTTASGLIYCASPVYS
jgi:hypothetical protein